MKDSELRWIRRTASKEEKDAVEAASKVEFPFPNTGMTEQEWRDTFGTMSHDEVCKFFVLTDDRPPSNPKEWRKFAKKCKRSTERMSGKKKK